MKGDLSKPHQAFGNSSSVRVARTAWVDAHLVEHHSKVQGFERGTEHYNN